MNNETRMNNIYQKAINVKGTSRQVGDFMEELADLTKEVNAYFNKNSTTPERVASKVANVELRIEQIKRMIGTNKFDNIMLSVDSNKVDYHPIECMSKCGKMINSSYLYFMKDGYDVDELVTNMINTHLTCQRIRKAIGDKVVDNQLALKTLRLIKDMEESE